MECCSGQHLNIVAAYSIEQSINPQVSPCDDFYEHACGRFISQTVLPKERNNDETFKKKL
jgi:predicted metalloendopeptidase